MCELCTTVKQGHINNCFCSNHFIEVVSCTFCHMFSTFRKILCNRCLFLQNNFLLQAVPYCLIVAELIGNFQFYGTLYFITVFKTTFLLQVQRVNLIHIWSEAFAATGFNKVFSGNQPRQMHKKTRLFQDRDDPRNIGFFYTSDVADCPRRLYWISLIQFSPSHIISQKYFLILYTHLCLGF
jgi:hypothetical protein